MCKGLVIVILGLRFGFSVFWRLCSVLLLGLGYCLNASALLFDIIFIFSHWPFAISDTVFLGFSLSTSFDILESLSFEKTVTISMQASKRSSIQLFGCGYARFRIYLAKFCFTSFTISTSGFSFVSFSRRSTISSKNSTNFSLNFCLRSVISRHISKSNFLDPNRFTVAALIFFHVIWLVFFNNFQ